MQPFSCGLSGQKTTNTLGATGLKGDTGQGSETWSLVLLFTLCSVTLFLINECDSVFHEIHFILKWTLLSPQSKILRSTERFFFFFLNFTFDKKTKLGTFLIGFTIFIFKLCFTVHLICTDSLLSLLFSLCLY